MTFTSFAVKVVIEILDYKNNKIIDAVKKSGTLPNGNILIFVSGA